MLLIIARVSCRIKYNRNYAKRIALQLLLFTVCQKKQSNCLVIAGSQGIQGFPAIPIGQVHYSWHCGAEAAMTMGQ